MRYNPFDKHFQRKSWIDTRRTLHEENHLLGAKEELNVQIKFEFEMFISFFNLLVFEWYSLSLIIYSAVITGSSYAFKIGSGSVQPRDRHTLYRRKWPTEICTLNNVLEYLRPGKILIQCIDLYSGHPTQRKGRSKFEIVLGVKGGLEFVCESSKQLAFRISE